MIGTTAAIIAASVIGAGASVAGAKMASGAANKAAETQAEAAKSATELEIEARNHAADLQKEAADNALALQREQWTTQQANMAPWLQAGQTSLQSLLTGMGLGTGGPLTSGELVRPFSMADFQQDPGFAFRLAEGQKALERSAAARGGILTGGALKAATRYGQDMASQEFNNAFNRFNIGQSNAYNRFANIAGLGQSSANQLGQFGQNYANQAGGIGQNYANNAGNIYMNSAGNIGDLQTQAANARASGYMGSANAWNSALGGIGGNIMNSILLSQLLKNPAGSSGSFMGTNGVVYPG